MDRDRRELWRESSGNRKRETKARRSDAFHRRRGQHGCRGVESWHPSGDGHILPLGHSTNCQSFRKLIFAASASAFHFIAPQMMTPASMDTPKMPLKRGTQEWLGRFNSHETPAHR